ncbi:MAG: hypothetical protein ACTSRE_13205 [Promethearchaeota archaeon]
MENVQTTVQFVTVLNDLETGEVEDQIYTDQMHLNPNSLTIFPHKNAGAWPSTILTSSSYEELSKFYQSRKEILYQSIPGIEESYVKTIKRHLYKHPSPLLIRYNFGLFSPAQRQYEERMNVLQNEFPGKSLFSTKIILLGPENAAKNFFIKNCVAPMFYDPKNKMKEHIGIDYLSKRIKVKDGDYISLIFHDINRDFFKNHKKLPSSYYSTHFQGCVLGVIIYDSSQQLNWNEILSYKDDIIRNTGNKQFILALYVHSTGNEFSHIGQRISEEGGIYLEFGNHSTSNEFEKIILSQLFTEPAPAENAERELMKKFKRETGKHAIWGGRVTKQFLRWKEQEKKKKYTPLAFGFFIVLTILLVLIFS